MDYGGQRHRVLEILKRHRQLFKHQAVQESFSWLVITFDEFLGAGSQIHTPPVFADELDIVEDFLAPYGLRNIPNASFVQFGVSAQL